LTRDIGERLGQRFGRLDGVGERHRSAHRRCVGRKPDDLPRGRVDRCFGAFRQPVPAAHDPRGVIEGEFIAGIREHLLPAFGDERLVHGQDQHPVVGE